MSVTPIKGNQQDNNWLEAFGHKSNGQETCDGKKEGEEEEDKKREVEIKGSIIH